MVWIIARRELLDVVRDGRFRWSARIVAALLLVSLAAGWKYQQQVSADHASSERFARAAWLAQPAKDPHSAAHYGSYAFKPREPLAMFDSGVNTYTGVAAFLEAHKQNEFQFRPAQDQTSVARFGELTAASTLQYLVPVLIVLLAFTRFAGEREDGTLKQVVASGVSRKTLAVGKTLGVAIALALVLVPAAFVGATAVILTSNELQLMETAGRAAALAAAYTAFFIVVMTVSLATSAVARSSSHALAILVAFWIFNAVLAPRFASDLSRSLYPTPTAFEFAEQVERATYDGLPVHAYNLLRAPALRDRLFKAYNVTRIEDLPVNFRGIDYLEREAHSNQVWDEHYGQLWSLFDHQARVHHLGGFAAPLLALRSMSMSLAGADVFHHRHFAAAAEAYRRQLVDAMNHDLAFSSTSRQLGYQAGSTLWKKLPAFHYQSPSLRWALSQQLWSISALGCWVALGAMALAWAIGKMPVD